MSSGSFSQNISGGSATERTHRVCTGSDSENAFGDSVIVAFSIGVLPKFHGHSVGYGVWALGIKSRTQLTEAAACVKHRMIQREPSRGVSPRKGPHEGIGI